ncbi:pVII [White sturgeon adenovirus 1]|uniref:PVII n=1 Tax=White sturgeon adenovirus 1 TaxID=2580388 RepID=A0A4P8PQU6_9ADEN|nr:pVII [White sturgeon adenovirus 1]QCQ84155.1 pVII [White sturgeon adenovirus 1]
MYSTGDSTGWGRRVSQIRFSFQIF